MSEATIAETWYLLYGGSSPDGCGQGRYIGRTTDKSVAKKHWRDCEANPYSVGSVTVVTDKSVHTATKEDWRHDEHSVANS